jgi:hypothetical protein
MIRRWLAIAALFLPTAMAATAPVPMATDAERTWREVRNSDDVRTKLMAARWYGAIKLQEWGDASGKFKTNAKYVEHDPNLAWVKLRVIQGVGDQRVVKDVTIPLEKLSKACQARVRTIGVLSEKIAEALAEEQEAEAEGDTNGGGRGEEMTEGVSIEGEMPAEPRDGRGGRDGGLAGMDPREIMAGRDPRDGREPSAESPPVVTNAGPPLPAVLPPLPSRNLTNADAAASPAASDASGFQHPTSVDELRAAFIRAFDAGDKETLEKLILWGESTPEHRELTRMYIVDKAGVAKTVRVDLETLPEGELMEDFTISSSTLFEIEYGNETSNNTLRWPYAAIDGKFYFGAWYPKTPQNRR